MALIYGSLLHHVLGLYHWLPLVCEGHENAGWPLKSTQPRGD